MQSEFNFFHSWYPLTPIEDLNPQYPTPVTLLGMRLVIWKPMNADSYAVFLDQCPHRLAPLSEGRVNPETGNLMCSYHGWEFDAKGSCTRIPQAENADLLSKNQQNFCSVVFPSRQEKGLLWVWPDANSAELAQQTPLPLSPQIDETQGFVWSSFVRDLEYDWQTLIENVVDPSHVPFTHHGVQGNRKQGRAIPLEITQSTPNLIEAVVERGYKTTITFEPPCRLEYAFVFNNGRKFGLVTYCLPVSPGKSRIVAQFPRNFAKTLHSLTPRWWDHTHIRNKVLDGDMIVLHQQEYFLQEREQDKSWKSAYQLPTQADRLVIEFRRWFDKYCDGKISWPNAQNVALQSPTINDNRKVLLDRYSQHTQHCSSCRGMLKTIQRLQWGILGYFALSVAATALLPDGVRFQVGLPLISLAVLGLGAYTWLKFWLEPQFYFVDYVHADKD